MKEFLQL